MVHYKDDKGVFDGPVEKVWQVLAEHTDERIPHIHAGFVSVRTVEEKGNVVVRDAVMRAPDGSTFTQRVRFTNDPPHAFTIEWLTGPLAGSKAVNRYVPEGDRTRVVVEGDFRMAGADEATTRAMVARSLDTAFEEDNALLKKMP